MSNLKKSLVFITTISIMSSLYSSTIGENGIISNGPQTMPQEKTIGKPASVDRKERIPGFPLFNSLELKGSREEVGAFYPILRVAFLQDDDGNTTYFTNVTPKAPAPHVASAYTQNFATTSANGKTVSLHAIAMTPELTTQIKAHYNMLIGTIPSIALNGSTIQNKTIGELWQTAIQMIGTLMPKPE